MGHSEHAEADTRAANAKALASSLTFSLVDQLDWASAARAPCPITSPCAAADLTHALVDAIERHACVEFVCGLVLDGADVSCASDDGMPLWRAAIIADARRDEEQAESSGWILLARLALGPLFLVDPRLPALKLACAECVRELQSHLCAQDAHFSIDTQASRVGELYSLLDARHDGALGLLAARCTSLAHTPPGPGAPGI